MVNNQALVLFSGGQDSTTCLFWARNKFDKVFTLGFDYGQRHHSEIAAAAKIAGLANVSYEIHAIDTFSTVSKNSLTNREIEINEAASKDQPPNTLVEGRNMLFLTYAAIYAKQLGADNLVIGVGQTDYSGYPDCRNDFILSANKTINLAFDHQFLIHTPLMWKTKAQIWEMADQLGVFDIVRSQTVTCYNGIPGEGCGECPSCRLRQTGLNEYMSLKSSGTVHQNQSGHGKL
jgi:7-cyano-7-deazaguanine synthase